MERVASKGRAESAVQIPVEMIHYGMTKTAQLTIARGLAERILEALKP